MGISLPFFAQYLKALCSLPFTIEAGNSRYVITVAVKTRSRSLYFRVLVLIRVGVYLKRREMKGNLKWFKKWVGSTTRQLTYPLVVPPSPTQKKREPQVGRGLFGVHLLIFHFKLQLSKSIKSSAFHIFHNLT